jgi:hypothetical protein
MIGQEASSAWNKEVELFTKIGSQYDGNSERRRP